MFSFRQIFAFHYLKKPLHPKIRDVYWNYVVRTFSCSLLLLYVPVYVYQVLGNNLSMTVIYFGSMSAGIGLVAPFIGRLTDKIGIRKMIFWSTPLLFLHYLSIYLLDWWPWLLWPSAVISSFAVAMYWIPFHTNFAKYKHKSQVAEEFRFQEVVAGLVSVAGPFIGGLVIMEFGFLWLFILSFVILSLSLIPLKFKHDDKDTYSSNYREAFKKLISFRYRSKFLGHMGRGVDFFVTTYILPLFLFVTVASFFHMGWMISLGVIATLLFGLWVAKLIDRWGLDKVLVPGSLIRSFLWFAGPLVNSLAKAFGFTMALGTSYSFYDTPYMGKFYVYSGKDKHQSDEEVVEREIAYNFIPGLVLIGIGIALAFFPNLGIGFVIAGVFAWMTVFMVRPKNKK